MNYLDIVIGRLCKLCMEKAKEYKRTQDNSSNLLGTKGALLQKFHISASQQKILPRHYKWSYTCFLAAIKRTD